jgi:hypothetical protein
MGKKVDDLSDPAGVKERDRRSRAVRRMELNDLSEMLSSRAGRNVVWRWLAECGVFRMSYDGENTHRTAFREGQRSIGNFVLADIEECDPEILTRLRAEERERQLAEEEDRKS